MPQVAWLENGGSETKKMGFNRERRDTLISVLSLHDTGLENMSAVRKQRQGFRTNNAR